MQTFLEMGGHFTLSDDSHEIAHIGACYQGVLDAIEKSGIQVIKYLTRSQPASIKGQRISTSSVTVSSLRGHDFFRSQT